MTPTDELPVFGPAPDRPEPRYSVSVDRHEWTVLEELVLWPVVAGRTSKADYDAACAWLCRTLNRVPQCAPDDVVYESVMLVEMRTVTRHIAGPSGPLVNRAHELLNTFRAGLPLSWAERCKILPSYARKPENDRPRISVEALVTLLGRSHDDTDHVRDYLHVLEHGGVDIGDDPDPTCPDPRRTARLAQRAAASGAPSVWREFTDALGEQ